MCDDILKQAVEGISDLITMPGIINVDFADIRSVMENAGSALMGIGTSSDEKRAETAARDAINSPLLEVSITGAKGVLFAITGGDDLGMLEIQDAARIITESIDPHAKVIFGAIKDEKLKKNEVKVTVIATGFPEAGSSVGREATIVRTPSSYQPVPTTASMAAEPKEEEETRGRIFNSLSMPRRREEEVSAPAAKPTPLKSDIKPEPRPVDSIDEEDDDDWGAVPAFLRRSKLK